MRIIETHKMRFKMRIIWDTKTRIFETHLMHLQCGYKKRLMNTDNAHLRCMKCAFDMHHMRIFDPENMLHTMQVYASKLFKIPKKIVAPSF